jgi:hypothetical protein
MGLIIRRVILVSMMFATVHPASWPFVLGGLLFYLAWRHERKSRGKAAPRTTLPPPDPATRLVACGFCGAFSSERTHPCQHCGYQHHLRSWAAAA